MIEKFVFDSGVKGVNLLVLGAVHGNEVAGPNALKQIIKEIENKKINILKGSLTLVPICNVEANKRDVRQIDENLNRVMKVHENPTTYEQKLANEICPLIENCDILLDLHSTHCIGDEPFAFCDYPDDNNLKLIDGLDVGFVLKGWPQIYDAQGDIEDYSTERAAKNYKKSATTLECGYHKEEGAKDVAYDAIVNTMKAFGLIDGEVLQKKEKISILMKEYVVKKKSGRLTKNYKHLDVISKGEKIAQYDDGEELFAVDDGYILLPNLEAEIGAEWYYWGVKE